MYNPYSDLTFTYQRAAQWVAEDPDEFLALMFLGMALASELEVV